MVYRRDGLLWNRRDCRHNNRRGYNHRRWHNCHRFIFGIDPNFSIRNNINNLVIRVKFKIIWIFECKFIVILKLFLVDEFLMNLFFEFSDGVGFKGKLKFPLELLGGCIEFDEVRFGFVGDWVIHCDMFIWEFCRIFKRYRFWGILIKS